MFVPQRKWLITSLILFFSLNCRGQSTIQYPVAFSQFTQYYSLLNPAATGTSGTFTFRAGEQVNGGYYSRIRSFFALAEYTPKRAKDKSGQSFGLSFTNTRQGTILAFNRAYAQYAYHLLLNKQWTMSGGMSVGFLNFSADQTSTSGSVSSFALDGSLGCMLHSEHHQIGFSSSQIFDQSLLIINERIPIRRLYRLYYSASLLLSPHLTFLPAALYTFKKEGSEFDLNMNLLINRLILCGISYRYNRGTAYFFGVRDLSFMGGFTDFTVSYTAPWPASGLGNIQTFELTLAYKIKP